MKTPRENIGLVSHKESWPLACGQSVLFYRRLGLGVLASLERLHAVRPPPGEAAGAPGQAVINRHALEAAVCAHVLVGWRDVLDHRGRPVEFSPSAALKLPASVKTRLLEAAMCLHPPAARAAEPKSPVGPDPSRTPPAPGIFAQRPPRGRKREGR